METGYIIYLYCICILFFLSALNCQDVADANRKCPPGYFGKSCLGKCPKECLRSCDGDGKCITCAMVGVQPPDCTSRCTKGWYGDNCSNKCSLNCKESECDPKTGDCLSCWTPGLALPKCESLCEKGSFGMHCRQRCSLLCADTCDPVTGYCRACLHGKGRKCEVNCADPKEANACKLYCPSRCVSWCDAADGTCNICDYGLKPPFCNETCDPSFYGKSCRRKCPALCKDGTCEPIKGLCSECNTGYVGEMCNGQCIPGLFGEQCLLTCPETCLDKLCNHVNGICVACLPGYVGPRCDELCPQGMFGEHCQSECPQTCGGLCDPITGECWQCTAGYRGPLCNDTCDEGRFGERCANRCSEFCMERSCHHTTGACDMCVDERTGKFCLEKLTEQKGQGFKSAIYLFLGCLAPVVIVPIAMAIYKLKINRKSKRLKRTKKNIKEQADEEDPKDSRSPSQRPDKPTTSSKYATIKRGIKTSNVYPKDDAGNSKRYAPKPPPPLNAPSIKGSKSKPAPNSQEHLSTIFSSKSAVNTFEPENFKATCCLTPIIQTPETRRPKYQILYDRTGGKATFLRYTKENETNYTKTDIRRGDVDTLSLFDISSTVKWSDQEIHGSDSKGPKELIIESTSTVSVERNSSRSSQVSKSSTLSIQRNISQQKEEVCQLQSPVEIPRQLVDEIQHQPISTAGTTSTPKLVPPIARKYPFRSDTLDNLQSLSDERNMDGSMGSETLACTSNDIEQIRLSSNTAVVSSESFMFPADINVKISSQTVIATSTPSSMTKNVGQIQVTTNATATYHNISKYLDDTDTSKGNGATAPTNLYQPTVLRSDHHVTPYSSEENISVYDIQINQDQTTESFYPEESSELPEMVDVLLPQSDTSQVTSSLIFPFEIESERPQTSKDARISIASESVHSTRISSTEMYNDIVKQSESSLSLEPRRSSTACQVSRELDTHDEDPVEVECVESPKLINESNEEIAPMLAITREISRKIPIGRQVPSSTLRTVRSGEMNALLQSNLYTYASDASLFRNRRHYNDESPLSQTLNKDTIHNTRSISKENAFIDIDAMLPENYVAKEEISTQKEDKQPIDLAISGRRTSKTCEWLPQKSSTSILTSNSMYSDTACDYTLTHPLLRGMKVEAIDQYRDSRRRGQPPVTVEQPPATEEHPPATEEDASATEEHSPATEEYPPANEEHTPATEEYPLATEEHPPATEEHPPATVEHPPATEEHPPATVKNLLATVYHLPATEERQPEEHSHGALVKSRETSPGKSVLSFASSRSGSGSAYISPSLALLEAIQRETSESSASSHIGSAITNSCSLQASPPYKTRFSPTQSSTRSLSNLIDDIPLPLSGSQPRDTSPAKSLPSFLSSRSTSSRRKSLHKLQSQRSVNAISGYKESSGPSTSCNQQDSMPTRSTSRSLHRNLSFSGPIVSEGAPPPKKTGNVIRCSTTRQVSPSPTQPNQQPYGAPRPFPTPPPRGGRGFPTKNHVTEANDSQESDNE